MVQQYEETVETNTQEQTVEQNAKSQECKQALCSTGADVRYAQKVHSTKHPSIPRRLEEKRFKRQKIDVKMSIRSERPFRPFRIDVDGRFDILMSRVFVHTSYLYVGGGS